MLERGRLTDLASTPEYLEEYLGIRVDIMGDEEVGTVIAHHRNLEPVAELVEKDKKSDNPGDEYHIFHPPVEGQTSRVVSSIFNYKKGWPSANKLSSQFSHF